MNCQACGHAPIMHVQDGLYTVCRVCYLLADEGQLQRMTGRLTICTNQFKFHLPRVEREQAARADKDSFPPHTVCAVPDCGFEWQQHMGYLCPSGDSTFVPLIESDLPFLRTH